MNKRIGLKIDIDTYQGARLGLPRLYELLQRHGARASFFISAGKDESGTEDRSSLKRFYPFKTRLYGRYLPAPVIGVRCLNTLQEIEAQGFEAAVRGWNRVRWEKNISTAPNPWIEAEMNQAKRFFETQLKITPRGFAAPGWITARHALRLTQRHGYQYASDCRGHHPFIPVINGEIVACPQLPTTLPSLDEIFTLEPGLNAELAASRLFQLSMALPGDQVFNLRTELEGNMFLAAFETLLAAWQKAEVACIALEDFLPTLNITALPRHSIIFEEIPGRTGKRAVQGPRFP